MVRALRSAGLMSNAQIESLRRSILNGVSG